MWKVQPLKTRVLSKLDACEINMQASKEGSKRVRKSACKEVSSSKEVSKRVSR